MITSLALGTFFMGTFTAFGGLFPFGNFAPYPVFAKIFCKMWQAGIVDIYVRLAVAGYISRLIPDNWFAGMAHFE